MESFDASFDEMRWTAARASFPAISISPMWLTSKRPARVPRQKRNDGRRDHAGREQTDNDASKNRLHARSSLKGKRRALDVLVPVALDSNGPDADAYVALLLVIPPLTRAQAVFVIP